MCKIKSSYLMFKVYGEVWLQRLFLYFIGEPEMKNQFEFVSQAPNAVHTAKQWHHFFVIFIFELTAQYTYNYRLVLITEFRTCANKERLVTPLQSCQLLIKSGTADQKTPGRRFHIMCVRQVLTLCTKTAIYHKT